MMSPDRLRAFLRDIRLGCMTRSGFARVSFHWLDRPATQAQRADLEAALRLGLVAWGGLVPGSAAVLTAAGAALLEVLP